MRENAQSGSAAEPMDSSTQRLVAPLFQPLSVRGLRLANRIVMSPMTREFSPNGVPGEDVVAYYRRRAEAETGLVITEGVGIDHPAALGEAGLGEADIPHLYGDEALAGWRRVVDAVHAVGGRIIPQLWHQGVMREPGTGPHPEAPSMRPSGLWGPTGLGQSPYQSITEIEMAEGKRDSTSLVASGRRLLLPIHPEGARLRAAGDQRPRRRRCRGLPARGRSGARGSPDGGDGHRHQHRAAARASRPRPGGVVPGRPGLRGRRDLVRDAGARRRRRDGRGARGRHVRARRDRRRPGRRAVRIGPRRHAQRAAPHRADERHGPLRGRRVEGDAVSVDRRRPARERRQRAGAGQGRQRRRAEGGARHVRRRRRRHRRVLPRRRVRPAPAPRIGAAHRPGADDSGRSHRPGRQRRDRRRDAGAAVEGEARRAGGDGAAGRALPPRDASGLLRLLRRRLPVRAVRRSANGTSGIAVPEAAR